MVERRDFLKGFGLGGALAWTGSSTAIGAAPVNTDEMASEAASLYEAVRDFPYDDTHCHPLTDADAVTTPQRFLERISLAAFPASSYFANGVYGRWQVGDESTRAELDREHGILPPEARPLNRTAHRD